MATHRNVLGITLDPKSHTYYIHTSIVSRRLATRGNNKILRQYVYLHHTLADLKRYFPASLVAPLPNSEQTHLHSQIILRQSRRQITSITTMPPL